MLLHPQNVKLNTGTQNKAIQCLMIHLTHPLFTGCRYLWYVKHPPSHGGDRATGAHKQAPVGSGHSSLPEHLDSPRQKSEQLLETLCKESSPPPRPDQSGWLQCYHIFMQRLHADISVQHNSPCSNLHVGATILCFKHSFSQTLRANASPVAPASRDDQKASIPVAHSTGHSMGAK